MQKEEISTQELPAAVEDMQAFIQQFEVKAEAEAPETVDCQVTLPIVLGSAGILSLVLAVVTIFFSEGGFETEAEGDIVIVIRGHMEIWAFWQEQLYI